MWHYVAIAILSQYTGHAADQHLYLHMQLPSPAQHTSSLSSFGPTLSLYSDGVWQGRQYAHGQQRCSD